MYIAFLVDRFSSLSLFSFFTLFSLFILFSFFPIFSPFHIFPIFSLLPTPEAKAYYSHQLGRLPQRRTIYRLDG